MEWKPIGTRTRGRPRKRWNAGNEKDLQIMGVRRWKSNVKKGQNGRKSLRRLKSTVGCNASKRRRRNTCMAYLPIYHNRVIFKSVTFQRRPHSDQ
jgi:hypothetical protein